MCFEGSAAIQAGLDRNRTTGRTAEPCSCTVAGFQLWGTPLVLVGSGWHWSQPCACNEGQQRLENREQDMAPRGRGGVDPHFSYCTHFWVQYKKDISKPAGGESVGLETLSLARRDYGMGWFSREKWRLWGWGHQRASPAPTGEDGGDIAGLFTALRGRRVIGSASWNKKSWGWR